MWSGRSSPGRITTGSSKIGSSTPSPCIATILGGVESYTSFIIVAAIAFVAPLIRGMVPRILVPAIVLELVAGIIVGPHGLGLASETTPVEVFSTVGLACLLFLAGREIQVERLRGALLATSLAGFAISSRWASAPPSPCMPSG